MRPIGLAVLALLLASSAARAQPVRLAIAELAAPPNLSGISAKLTQDIVDAAAKEPGAAVVQPGEVAKALGAEELKRLYECNGKAGCVAAHAGALAADRLVVGSLDRTETSYLVKLWLIDLKARSQVAQVDRSILIASRRLQSDVAAALPGLLAGKAEAHGKLAVSATRAGATIFFDGEVVGRTPMTIDAKPGKHTLKLSRQGYLDVERFVTVPEEGTEQLALTLLAIPGAKVEEEELPMVARKAPESGGSEVTVPVASWVLGGAAVASAGVATYFAVVTGSLTSKAGDKTGTPPAYAISRSDAQSGKRDAIVADVLFGVAGASAATALILGFVLQEPPSEAPKAAVAPLKGGAALTFSGSF